MDRQNELTRSCCVDLNPGSWYPSNARWVAGKRNYLQCFGAYGLLPTGQQAIRRFSWSMAQKPYFQATFAMTPLEWQLMWSLIMSMRDKTLLMPWKKNANLLRPDQQFTNKTYVAITAVEFEAELFRKVT
jgi:hypothetical protein